MIRNLPIRPRSVFDDLGLSGTIESLVAQTQKLYLEDAIPWVIGYSGGKDSTAVLQLVWMSLAQLPQEKRSKTVHVISTDTLVENPVVAAWVTHSLDTIAEAAREQDLPIEPHRLTPTVSDTFWVNLAGRGYPAPRPKFRWCTERLKIKPSNTFIINMVKSHGEAILVLGTRKAESSGRSHRMTELEGQRVRDKLSPNGSLPNCLVYSPVEDWSNDDVWTFLMQTKNPWGYSNKELLTMYQGASSDGECPLVVDSSTPSCGDSRFGCWTCTLVDKDKSMSAMIQNDEEKEWMLPLLELRNELDVQDDRHLRDFRRMNGSVQLFNGRNIPGPYTQESRERWVRKLLDAQTWIRENGPASVRNLDLVTLDELEEIRRIWVVDKHEFEDSLPRIYRESTGTEYPGRPLDEHLPLGPDTVEILREVVGDDRVHFELVRELLDVEQRHRSQARRAGLFDSLTKSLRKGFYEDEEDAMRRATGRADAVERLRATDEPDDLDIADGYIQPARIGSDG
ncbi:DNA phosphorothioation system sulfurtransferase DndC [Rhodococcus qingshengii]|uniref:DNA phosphorothioation system sulfurtransferase DndC n=1 Tax=Rhodococcus TaxID=1827 RepID=UPI001BAEDEC9|nr:DNA phosphorothioation system sulfurtransferase DndC [Rhodococcus qingshengii]MBS3695244.1 DNA phosphorothioation system sulfurtransferase DndC [Rhodococcus qingshengii]